MDSGFRSSNMEEESLSFLRNGRKMDAAPSLDVPAVLLFLLDC